VSLQGAGATARQAACCCCRAEAAAWPRARQCCAQAWAGGERRAAVQQPPSSRCRAVPWPAAAAQAAHPPRRAAEAASCTARARHCTWRSSIASGQPRIIPLRLMRVLIWRLAELICQKSPGALDTQLTSTATVKSAQATRHERTNSFATRPANDPLHTAHGAVTAHVSATPKASPSSSPEPGAQR
jgi:hypothetical protein